MPYQEGLVPFIRTSDIQNLEITKRPQKWVNHEIYENQKQNQDIKTYDLLFVKDGMERIGETAMVMPGEEQLILQSHLFKLRINTNQINLDNFNFLYFLNQEYVVKQIKKLIFAQGTIPTIGERIKELTLWIPKNKEECRKISDYMKKSLLFKYEFKKELKTAKN